MKRPARNLIAIQRHRALTESQLQGLLDRAKSSLTLAEVQQVVFEAGRPDFQRFLLSMLATLDYSDIADVDDAILQIIQDTWNYFPHRDLGGKCPAELIVSAT